MSGYRFLTGRQRRISYGGTYSYDYRLQVDLTQTGLHPKVGKVFSGASFVGWALAIDIQKRSVCVAGLEANYIKGITDPPEKMRLFFGPIYTYNGSEDECIIQVRDAATGEVLEEFDAGWDGVTEYDDSDVDEFAGIAGWQTADVHLFSAGALLTVTDTYEGSHSGDWEILADLEEAEWRRYVGFFDNELEPSGSLVTPTDLVEFGEVYRPGGIAGSIVGSVDDTVTITDRLDPPLNADLFWPWCLLNCQASGGQTANASLTATWNGGGYIQTPTPMSVSHADGSASESSVSAASPSAFAVRRSSSASQFPVKWKLVGRANCIAFGASIPESATVEWTDGTYTNTGTFPLSRGASGEFGFTFRAGQARAGSNPSVLGSGTPTSHNSGDFNVLPPSQFTCRLSDASFAALRVQTQRFCIRGPGWDQFSIYQEQYKYYAKDEWHPIESLPYSTKGWYPGATAAIDDISIVSGNLHIETSAAGGDPTQRAAVLMGLNDRIEMRHVGIRIRSIGADDLPFTLRLNAEEFDSTTGADGVWVERMFDRYDVHVPLLDYTALIPEDALGEVAVQDLSVSSTYEIEWIRGERMDHSKVHISAAFQLITDTLLTRQAALKDDGGELSFLLLPNGTDTGDNPSSWVMEDLAVAPVDMPDNVYDTLLPAETTFLTPEYHRNSTAARMPWLEGMGSFGGWLDAEVEGAANEGILRAYPLAVSMSGYPGAGDIFGQGDYGEATQCNFDMVLRGQAFGPILGPGSMSQEVVLTELDEDENDNGERGRGSADGDGYYKTGPPYARHLLGQFTADWVRAWLDDQQPAALLTNKIGDGFRWWILWRTTGENVRWPSADINRMWRAVRTYLNDDDEVIIGFINSPVGVSWESYNTGIVAEHPCVRYGKGVSDGRIILVYEDAGGAVVRQATLDEGRSWSMATTIFAAGEYPTVALSPTGVEHHFAQDGDGAILTRILDPQGEEIEAETVVVPSGAAEDAMYAFERGGYIYLGYKNTGGAVVTVRSLDGVTYS